MADDQTRSPVPAPSGGRVPDHQHPVQHRAQHPAQPLAEPPACDAHGFDPTEFEWRPVARRRRTDGWTPEVQRRFIETLAETGLVTAACEAVDMSQQSAYRLRRAAGGQGFARAWVAAMDAAADRMVDLAFERAVEGEEVPIFDRDGCRIGSRRRPNDRLMMFILRAYRPDRFRQADRDADRNVGGNRRPADATPAPPTPPAPSLDQAVAALSPVVPAAPHLLMPPERLADAIDVARQVADVHELYPDDDRERYRRPRVADDHPAATERRRRRMSREQEREEREETYEDRAARAASANRPYDSGLTFD